MFFLAQKAANLFFCGTTSVVDPVGQSVTDPAGSGYWLGFFGAVETNMLSNKYGSRLLNIINIEVLKNFFEYLLNIKDPDLDLEP